MPVDSHHHRIVQRLGLIGSKTTENATHKLLAIFLPADWNAQQVYDHHKVFMYHGQKCCYFSSPACTRYVVLDQYPFR